MIKDFQIIKECPPYLQIETINICNANCNMCCLKQSDRKQMIMDDNIYNKIIDNISNHSDAIKMVQPQLFGEPLLDKQIAKRIKMLKDIGIKRVSIATNGSLLDKIKARNIIKSGLDRLDISIDGLTKEVYESIRIGLKHKDIYENTKRLISMRNDMGSDMQVRIRIALQDMNRDEYKDFRIYWNNILGPKDIISGKIVFSWGENINLNYLIDDYTKSPISKPCISPWNSFIILVDGRVPLCCVDYNCDYEIGNITKQTIEEIWNNQKFNDIRKIHNDGMRNLMDICKNCYVWERNDMI